MTIHFEEDRVAGFRPSESRHHTQFLDGANVCIDGNGNDYDREVTNGGISRVKAHLDTIECSALP
jgi:hypothetical protein